MFALGTAGAVAARSRARNGAPAALRKLLRASAKGTKLSVPRLFSGASKGHKHKHVVGISLPTGLHYN